jgi:hypothetical protein
MLKIQQISLIAIIAIGVGALLLPGTGLTQAAFAYHNNHNNGGTHLSIEQNLIQKNSHCEEAICANIGLNNINFGHQ